MGGDEADCPASVVLHTVAKQSMLERIVDERVGQSLVGSVSVAIDWIAEEIAREALADETFAGRYVSSGAVAQRNCWIAYSGMGPLRADVRHARFADGLEKVTGAPRTTSTNVTYIGSTESLESLTP